jgi:preprotein translocase subunit SecD
LPHILKADLSMLYFAPWKKALILLVLLLGALFVMPNFVPESARLETVPGKAKKEPIGIWRFLPHRGINLGLDLRGGSYLLYEVDVSAVRLTQLEKALDRVAFIARDQACGEAGAHPGAFCPAVTGQMAEGGNYATVRVTDPKDFDETLRRLRNELTKSEGGSVGRLGVAPISPYGVERGPSGNEIRITVTDDSLADIKKSTVDKEIEIIRRRIDELGTTEPVIQRQGSERIAVQAPGEQDPNRLKDIIGKTAQMTFHLVSQATPAEIEAAQKGRPAPTQELFPTDDPREPYLLVDKRLDINDTTRGPDGGLVRVLSGDYLNKAWQGYSQQTGQPVVNFQFNTTGAIIFGKLTANHVGQRFAVVLDDKVITAPRINGAIPGGTGYIEGRDFTVKSAHDLAALLNAGALPAKLTIVEQRTVGATLGTDSVRAGALALVVGFLAVVVFMIVAYGRWGVFASAALLANLILIGGALSALQATLTLPGIGGIILTMGMAVDANVLIFERIRDETMHGRTPANAIEAGYQGAMSAIIDSNVTTLVASALLFLFGSGSVRGFAVTLGIGVITSLFTAILLARLITATWYRAVRPKVITVG